MGFFVVILLMQSYCTKYCFRNQNCIKIKRSNYQSVTVISILVYSLLLFSLCTYTYKDYNLSRFILCILFGSLIFFADHIPWTFSHIDNHDRQQFVCHSLKLSVPLCGCARIHSSPVPAEVQQTFPHLQGWFSCLSVLALGSASWNLHSHSSCLGCSSRNG